MAMRWNAEIDLRESPKQPTEEKTERIRERMKTKEQIKRAQKKSFQTLKALKWSLIYTRDSINNQNNRSGQIK